MGRTDQFLRRRGVQFKSCSLASFPAHQAHATVDSRSGGGAATCCARPVCAFSVASGEDPAELEWECNRRAGGGHASGMIVSARGSSARNHSRSRNTSWQRSGSGSGSGSRGFASVVGALQDRMAGAPPVRWLDGAKRRLRGAPAADAAAGEENAALTGPLQVRWQAYRPRVTASTFYERSAGPASRALAFTCRIHVAGPKT